MIASSLSPTASLRHRTQPGPSLEKNVWTFASGNGCSLNRSSQRVNDFCERRPLEDDCTVVAVNYIGEGVFG